MQIEEGGKKTLQTRDFALHRHCAFVCWISKGNGAFWMEVATISDHPGLCRVRAAARPRGVLTSGARRGQMSDHHIHEDFAPSMPA